MQKKKKVPLGKAKVISTNVYSTIPGVGKPFPKKPATPARPKSNKRPAWWDNMKEFGGKGWGP